MEDLLAEVYQILSMRKDWMTRDEIKDQFEEPQPNNAQLNEVLSRLIEHKRVERKRRPRKSTHYRVKQTKSAPATRSKTTRWRSKLVIPSPLPA